MEIKKTNRDLRSECETFSEQFGVDCNLTLLYNERFNCHELHYEFNAPEKRNNDDEIVKEKYCESGVDYCTRKKNETDNQFIIRTKAMIERRFLRFTMIANDMLDPKTGIETRKW